MSEEVPRRLPEDFIWSSSGQKHVEYGNGEKFEGQLGTYDGHDELGEGGQASVSVVILKGKALARKRMHQAGFDEEALREAHILENIVHRHIIQIIGSYTLNRRLYILLYPIAECTLREYITMPIHSRDAQWEKELKECFGCLANTIAFLHSKRVAIKHKDIKPSNVLMFRGTPIITDFGISNSFKGKDHSESTGYTLKSTLYAAPEVIHFGKRNTSQDVFSLGLVFLDMYWALRGKAHNRSDFNGDEREGPYSGTVLEEQDLRFSGDMVKLAYEQSPSLQEPEVFLKIIRLMTAVRLDQRPTADTLWNVLTNQTFFGQACGDCCLPQSSAGRTHFTEWTGIHTYLPIQLRVPFDEKPQINPSAMDEMAGLEEGMDVPDLRSRTLHDSEPFDWTGERKGFFVAFDSEEQVPLSSIRVLGHGQSGIVEAVKCNRKLIVRKTVFIRRSPFRSSENTLIQRFRAEVTVMGKLSHPHIIQILGSYSTRRSVSILIYPVCQFDLDQFFQRCQELRETKDGKLRARAIRITLKRSAQCLVQALEYLHENRIRHNDIKPRNILYQETGSKGSAHVYLADFGISTVLDPGESTVTRTVGTPFAATWAYTSPETFTHVRRGRASDVFSLGCVFYEILATVLCLEVERDRFVPYGASMEKLHVRVKEIGEHNGKVEGLQIPPGQIGRLAHLIVEMTQRNPQERPSTSDIALRMGFNDCCYLEPKNILEEEDYHEDGKSGLD